MIPTSIVDAYKESYVDVMKKGKDYFSTAVT